MGNLREAASNFNQSRFLDEIICHLFYILFFGSTNNPFIDIEIFCARYHNRIPHRCQPCMVVRGIIMDILFPHDEEI